MGLSPSPVLWSPKRIAGYLLERLADSSQEAAGAVFLDERRTALGLCVTQSAPLDPARGAQVLAAREILGAALFAGATRLVPFMFATDTVLRPARLDAGFYEELHESSHYFDLEIADFLYVWKTGRFLARSQGGEMQRVDPGC